MKKMQRSPLTPIWLLSLALLPLSTTRAAPTPAPSADTQVQYLSGTGKDDQVVWDFYCTGGRHSGAWTTIHVPSCWEQEGFGVYEYGLERRPSKKKPNPPFAHEQGLYRHDFEVPKEWTGGEVQLVFEGVMTDAEVKVNGQVAGPIHQGAFYRFTYNVTPLLHFGGSNRIEVTVSKSSANKSVNQAEREGDYWNFGGIFRPVYLERRPAQNIQRLALDARADGSLAGTVFLGGPSQAGERIVTQILGTDGSVVGATATVDIAAGATSQAIHLQADHPNLWTAETPSLYTLDVSLEQGTQVEHHLQQRFGFRTFEVRPGDGLYLNGSKIKLKGVCRHSFWPESARTLSDAICYDDVRLLKEANMNAVRMSHYPPDAAFLQACDELGLYVLDELGGWHGAYDTPTGASLIGEMVRRDVNHPSILFWDNGNEGGNNLANDGEFAKWDPQHRPVLHPWATFSNVATTHYRDYATTVKLLQGPDIFMPTEFLHGMYDGGAGAGMEDYWAVMNASPFSAGGFVWAFLDESVARTDENGRLDSKDSWAPDGIVGPHREKEGSFFTLKQVWSPVQVGPDVLPSAFDGTLDIDNRYDFTPLSKTSIRWELVRFAGPRETGTHQVLQSGSMRGPDVAPHAHGQIHVPLPAHWQQADALYVSVIDPAGKDLWTWSWDWPPAAVSRAEIPAGPGTTTSSALSVVQGNLKATFDPSTGELSSLASGGHNYPLSQGPRFVVYRRVGKAFTDLSKPSKLVSLTRDDQGGVVVVTARYDGALRAVRWTFVPGKPIQIDFDAAYEGTVDIAGVTFAFPQDQMQAKRWLGAGGYHVWQNRLKGTRYDVWQTPYDNTVPGDTWDYPEFKGFFADWRWAVFTTKAGQLAFLNTGNSPYLGVYSPNDGRVDPILPLPKLGLGVYEVINAQGNKTATPDLTGPHGQPGTLHGTWSGSLSLQLWNH